MKKLKKLFLLLLILITTTINVASIYRYFSIIRIEKNTQEYTSTQSKLTLDSIFDRKVQAMTIEQKRGAMFMVSIPDAVLSQSTIDFLKENNIGGVILLGNNIENETQVKQLTSDLKSKVAEDLLISIDQEGGTVTRIDWDKYASLSARELGNKNDLNYTYEVAKYRAELLKGLGINTILGPVVDVADSDSFMYSRSYSNDPEIVKANVEKIVQAQEEAGIITVLKHFPGHGDTETDSHYTFPVINKSVEELKANEFIPFRAGIDSGADMIMLGHIINPQIDSNPASISLKYKELLETETGFSGLIITDDLKMTGEIKGGMNWGINLDIESTVKIKARMSEITPEDAYVKKLLELKYEKL